MRSTTGSTNIGDDRYTYVVEYPEELFFADSRTVEIRVTVYDRDGVPESDQEIVLSMTDAPGIYGADVYAENRYADASGSARFDVARYAQIILGSLDDDTTFNDGAYWAKQKEITFTLKFLGATLFTFTAEACHGCNTTEDRWWKQRRRLRYWENFPFLFDMPYSATLSVVASNQSYTEQFPASGYSDLGLSHPRARIPVKMLPNRTGNMTVIATGGYHFDIATAQDTGHARGTKLFVTGDTYVDLVSDGGCNPVGSGVYIRWFDRHDEVHFWLFRPYSEKLESKADILQGWTDRIDRLALPQSSSTTDYMGMMDFDGRRRSGTTSTEIVVKTDQLQGWEYDIVKTIMESPFVDVYDSGDAFWKRLQVKPGSLQCSLRGRSPRDCDRVVAVTLMYESFNTIGS